MSAAFTINFLPAGISVTGDADKTILTLARENGLWVESACGGAGRCRSCLVRLEGETLPAPGAGELRDLSSGELEQGWRRACRTIVTSDCRVTLGTMASRLHQSSQGRGEQDATLTCAPLVSHDEAANSWVDSTGKAYPGSLSSPPLGLAFDLGTTNIAAMLVDLSSGRVIGEKGATNPQVYYGADIVSRLNYAIKDENCAHRMQSLAVETLQKLADDVSEQQSERVCAVAVAGNTVMHHALHDLPQQGLASAPYAPAQTAAMQTFSRDIGLALAADAELYTPPNIAGFVGGDHVAALTEIVENPCPDCWAMIDIGTNTEIALSVDGRIFSASCASGPAFEGGHISCGMRAATGAIEKITLVDDELQLSTIDSGEPVGICGSGIISITANLCRNGLVNKRGRLQLDSTHIRERSGKREFVLSESQGESFPVVFSQQDVRSVQLAKGAIMTGLELLLARAGIGTDALQALYVAGTFGTYIDIADAMAIGMLPDIPQARIQQIGNAAKRGAGRLLTSHGTRRLANELADRIEYVELASAPGFQKTFIRCNQFQESLSS